MSEDEKLAFAMSEDEQFAFDFLCGETICDADGHMTHRYLEPGSEHERRGQAALVRLLRNQALPMNLCMALAGLLDPAHTTQTRELVIQNRQKGVQPNTVIDIAIARDVAAEVLAGCPVEAAIASAMKRYGVARSTAYDAWKKHRMVWLAGRDTRLN
jgi:hypothetical protein